MKTEEHPFADWTLGDLERALAQLDGLFTDLLAQASKPKGGARYFRMRVESIRAALEGQLLEGDPSTPVGLKSHFKAQGALEMLGRIERLFDYQRDLEERIAAEKSRASHA